MQRRFCDRGHVYDYAAWRQIFGGLQAPGVYRGFELTVDGTFLKLGASHTDTSPGMLMMSSGIGVAETSAVSLAAPSVAGNYTILAEHTDNELIGGTAATYRIATSHMTTNPTNGIILGWINHDGSSFANWMLTPAYKLNPLDISKQYVGRAPMVWSPPSLLVDSLGACVAAEGWDSTNYVLWRGVSYFGVGNASVTARLQWRVNYQPYALRVRSIIPTACQMQAKIYDVDHVMVASTVVFTPHSSWTWDSLVNNGSNQGTWRTGEDGIIELTLIITQNCTIKIADVVLDSWPYGLAQF